MRVYTQHTPSLLISEPLSAPFTFAMQDEEQLDMLQAILDKLQGSSSNS